MAAAFCVHSGSSEGRESPAQSYKTEVQQLPTSCTISSGLVSTLMQHDWAVRVKLESQIMDSKGMATSQLYAYALLCNLSLLMIMNAPDSLRLS